jgi:hypothetical protein
MAKFVRFVANDGRDVFINPEQVTHIRPKQNGTTILAIVYFGADKSVEVNASPERVVAAFEEGRG